MLAVLARARQAGFLGPAELREQVAHAEGFLPADACPVRAVDLGSGGGLPGLVLALRFPCSTWVLLDASQRRTAQLTEAVATLGLAGRVAVHRARAEEAGRDPLVRGTADLVVARSFGSPAVTAECAAPLLVVGGRLVVSEPPAGAARRWPADALAPLGLVPGSRRRDRFGYQELRQVEACPARFPRRVGIPAKRPLF